MRTTVGGFAEQLLRNAWALLRISLRSTFA